MNLYMIGSLLPNEVFDELVRKSRSKPSNAPVNFQNMFTKGIAENKQIISVLSFPTIASFPHGPGLLIRNKKYSLGKYLSIDRPLMLNIFGAKQISIYSITAIKLFIYAYKHRNEKTYIISYSDYPFYSAAVRHITNMFKNARSVLLMTDLPTYSLFKHRRNPYSVITNMMDSYRKQNYRNYDAYIVLTSHMIQSMGIQNKPSIVIEGFSDPEAFNFTVNKSPKKTIMYAGALGRVHNTSVLIDAFMKTKIDAELWIFGSGELEGYIRECAQIDNRIIFFGKVSRSELLRKQKEASLLVSVKSSKDEHTKDAFPSKILEYMTSGTAVLTTRVGGIPDEYYDYVYTFEDESIDGIAAKIEYCLNAADQELLDKGISAYNYVSKKKNCKVQAERIIRFLDNLC